MNFNEFLDFITKTYNEKILIACDDRFSPEGSKKFTSLTNIGLISYYQKLHMVTITQNGHVVTQYTL